MNSLFLEDLDKLLKYVKSSLAKIEGRPLTCTVAIFDLPASTPLKLEGGHTLGTRTALMHNLICRRIVEKFSGDVVKELGDGVLCKFDDPVKACLAAINIKKAVSQMPGLSTKGGLTIGSVEEMDIGGIPDIIGNTIDRCARLQAYALPEQILVDRALHDVVASFLRDYPSIQFSRPILITVAGIGAMEVYEVSTEELGLSAYIKVPFQLHEEGRPSIQEKVTFMKDAQQEVIELGIGLTTFTGYFHNRRPSEFRNHIVELLRRGVRFRCVALDPDCPIAAMYARDRNEPHLLEDIRNSLIILQELKTEFARAGLVGSLEVCVYHHFPYFYAACIDGAEPHGRMKVSHYMHAATRAETPAMELSRSSNAQAFEKYWLSIRRLLKDSSQL